MLFEDCNCVSIDVFWRLEQNISVFFYIYPWHNSNAAVFILSLFLLRVLKVIPQRSHDREQMQTVFVFVFWLVLWHRDKWSAWSLLSVRSSRSFQNWVHFVAPDDVANRNEVNIHYKTHFPLLIETTFALSYIKYLNIYYAAKVSVQHNIILKVTTEIRICKHNFFLHFWMQMA